MGIKLEGIHFHCGSGLNGASSFKKSINMAKACIEIGRKFGHKMETLDLGGGYPAGEIEGSMLEALKMTKDDPLGYRVIAEPGRYLCSNTGYIFTRVIGKRNKNNKNCLHVNDSLYHQFNCVLMDGISFENDKNQFYGKIDSNGDHSHIS